MNKEKSLLKIIRNLYQLSKYKYYIKKIVYFKNNLFNFYKNFKYNYLQNFLK